jgi:hypothetical protein
MSKRRGKKRKKRERESSSSPVRKVLRKRKEKATGNQLVEKKKEIDRNEGVTRSLVAFRKI